MTTHGRLRFDEFMDLALYDPDSGFYCRGGAAGRRGDFITSVEVGPLFAAVVARFLDEVWQELDRPDPFLVVEAGAGRGALAIAVRSASPRCATALHWLLVERSSALRELQGEHLMLEESSGFVHAGDPPRVPGPRFATAAAMPVEPFEGVVLANELLDNLAVRMFERAPQRWTEVCVQDRGDGSLVEVIVPAGEEVIARLDALVGHARPGDRVPLQEQAATWVREALWLLQKGRLLLFDYCDTTASMASRPHGSWLRTYRGHSRGGSPLESPGEQDITVEVAIDQLPGGPDRSINTQAEWLRAHGLDELVEAARLAWRAGAATGDLAALRARSALSEADALCDAAGLGGFSAMEWRR